MDVSGLSYVPSSGGRLAVGAGDLTLEGSNLLSNSYGPSAGLGIDIETSNSVLLNSTSGINGFDAGPGPGSAITISTSTYYGYGGVISDVTGTGNGGDITLKAGKRPTIRKRGSP